MHFPFSCVFNRSSILGLSFKRYADAILARNRDRQQRRRVACNESRSRDIRGSNGSDRSLIYSTQCQSDQMIYNGWAVQTVSESSRGSFKPFSRRFITPASKGQGILRQSVIFCLPKISFLDRFTKPTENFIQDYLHCKMINLLHKQKSHVISIIFILLYVSFFRVRRSSQAPYQCASLIYTKVQVIGRIKTIGNHFSDLCTMSRATHTDTVDSLKYMVLRIRK